MSIIYVLQSHKHIRDFITLALQNISQQNPAIDIIMSVAL